MKPVTVCVVLLIGLSSVCGAQYCEEMFDGPEGTVPSWLFSTGDPADAGSFSQLDGAFVHDSDGPAHYVSDLCQSSGAMFMSLWIEGTGWQFAWDITRLVNTSGRCLVLSHGEHDGEWRYTLDEVSWELPDGTTPPETQFTWHNGAALNSFYAPTAGPLTGWHYIEVVPGSRVRIHVDGELIFDEQCELLIRGQSIGYGCAGGASGSPAFSSVWVQGGSPVEQQSWGAIKALFRQEP